MKKIYLFTGLAYKTQAFYGHPFANHREPNFLHVLFRVMACALLAFSTGCTTTEPVLDARDDCGSDPTREGNLGVLVNSQADDYGAWLAPDGMTLYYSSSRSVRGKRRKSRNAELLFATRTTPFAAPFHSGWSAPRVAALGYVIDRSISVNQGAASFSGDGEIGVLAIDRVHATDEDRVSVLMDLYEIRRLSDGSYSDPQLIEAISAPDAWDSQPALSADGLTLYFVSNRPKTPGALFSDLDIFYASRPSRNAAWSRPQRLGAPVNTPSDDVTPFYSDKGYLYYATAAYPNGVDGLGGKDIFRVRGAPSSGFGAPERLPEPLNSRNNDEYPVLTNDGKIMLLTSDRGNGCGRRDIYAFDDLDQIVPKEKEPKIELRVAVAFFDADNQPLPEGSHPGYTVLLAKRNTEDEEIQADTFYKLQRGHNYTVRLQTASGACIECEVENGPTRSVASHAYKDSIIEVRYRVICRENYAATIVLSDRSNIPYFVTGYWFPNTSENYAELQRRRASGCMQRKPKYIDLNDCDYAAAAQAVDRIFETEVYSAIRTMLRRLDSCENSYKLKITVHGYTDSSGLIRDDYICDPSVTVGGVIIASGMDMLSGAFQDESGATIYLSENRTQRGNIALAKLRSYFTWQTIHNAMQSNTDSELYNRLYTEERIVAAYDGFGILENVECSPSSPLREALPRDNIMSSETDYCPQRKRGNPASRRVVVYLDVVSESDLERGHTRTACGEVEFRR